MKKEDEKIHQNPKSDLKSREHSSFVSCVKDIKLHCIKYEIFRIEMNRNKSAVCDPIYHFDSYTEKSQREIQSKQMSDC